MEKPKVTATLPYPISVNEVWMRSKSGMFLNPKVVRYRKEAWTLLHDKPPFHNGRLRLEVKMYPPRVNCDIDNILKTLLDALQHAQLIKNDSQIHQLFVEKLETVKGGRIEITLTEM